MDQPVEKKISQRAVQSTPWMFARLMRSGEKRHFGFLQDIISQALLTCLRCSRVFQQTGLVPCACADCGAQRDLDWLLSMERLASLAAGTEPWVEPAPAHVRRERLG